MDDAEPSGKLFLYPVDSNNSDVCDSWPVIVPFDSTNLWLSLRTDSTLLCVCT